MIIKTPIVMKFGGSCLKSADHFLQIVDILKERKTEPTIVVVSAMYEVTNILESSIASALESDTNIDSIIEGIRNLHLTVMMKVIENFQIRQGTLECIDERLQKLQRLLYGISYTGEVTDTIRVLILSYGERFASLLLTGVLLSNGIQAKCLESDKIGLVTDSVCNNATADLTTTSKNLCGHLNPLLDDGVLPIITGFFGCTEDGKTSSFGRNGSDYSAAVITSAMGLDELHIWKDVDGLMTADPSVIPSAKPVKHLSFLEAAELSYFGARVFHPRTVEPLLNSDIHVYVRNLEDPTSCTLVEPIGETKRDVIKSVTFNKSIGVLRIHGVGVGHKPGIIGDVGQCLSKNNINIYSVITAQTCINLLLNSDDLNPARAVLTEFVGGVIDRIEVRNDVALVAVVGEGLLTTKGLAARVFSAVADAGINVEMFSAGASAVAYYFIVDATEVDSAVKAVHSQFFGRK